MTPENKKGREALFVFSVQQRAQSFQAWYWALLMLSA